uniref:Uncharacterized protein n=1 Tax=Oryza brachyantha TaxID=4533 RepID=J3LB99_ORYBR
MIQQCSHLAGHLIFSPLGDHGLSALGGMVREACPTEDLVMVGTAGRENFGVCMGGSHVYYLTTNYSKIRYTCMIVCILHKVQAPIFYICLY